LKCSSVLFFIFIFSLLGSIIILFGPFMISSGVQYEQYLCDLHIWEAIINFILYILITQYYVRLFILVKLEKNVSFLIQLQTNICQEQISDMFKALL